MTKEVLKLSEIVDRANYMVDFWEKNGRDMSAQKHYIIAGAEMVVRDLLSPEEYDNWCKEVL